MQERQQQEQPPRKIKQRGRLLASVLESLRNVFQWTTTSIGSGMKQSESFLLVDNGELQFFLSYKINLEISKKLNTNFCDQISSGQGTLMSIAYF